MSRTLIKTLLLASGAAVLIAAGPKADLNQDGQVSKAEFTQAAESRFYATDTNNDGFLSEEERKTQKEADLQNHQDQRFSKLDTNGDGLLSRDEMSAGNEKRKSHMEQRRAQMETRRKAFMERYDTNLDGSLSDAERTVMKAEIGEKRGGLKGKLRGKRAERPQMDTNGDGLVSLDEYMAISEQLFTRMDANADGVLTKGEGQKRKGKRGFRSRR